VSVVALDPPRGVGPNEADYLKVLDGWVTDGTAPDSIVARHVTNGVGDNGRTVAAARSGSSEDS